MANAETDNMRMSQRPNEDWGPDYRPSGQTQHNGGPSLGLFIGGVALVGLGVLAWNLFGPDLIRYIKIERM